MPTEQEIAEAKAQADAEAKAKADAEAAEKAIQDAEAAAEKGESVSDDIVVVKKSSLVKVMSDRNNYKKMGLQKKADERELHGEGGGNVATVDEKKVGEVATAATNKALRDAGEKTAKRAFLQKHPEYLADSDWVRFVSHLAFKGTEVTHEDVMDRMEAALLEDKRSTGKLEEYLKSETERARREGNMEAQINMGRDGGGAGDRNDGKGGGEENKGAVEMASRFSKTDPKKVEKVNPAVDREILNI